MIFNHTWRQVLDGSKTQTRRLVKPGDIATNEFGNYLGCAVNGLYLPIVDAVRNEDTWRIKWQVGESYAVQPERGKATIHRRKMMTGDYEYTTGKPGGNGGEQWEPCRIPLIAIRQEPLLDITKEDAVAEGCNSKLVLSRVIDGGLKHPDFSISARGDFAVLWNTIHTKPGTRWTDNPDVWVLEWEPLS